MTLLLERENTNSFALDLAKSTKPVGFPGGASGDEPANVGDTGDGVQSPWQPSPVFLPGESIPWTEEPGGLQSIGSQKSWI